MKYTWAILISSSCLAFGSTSADYELVVGPDATGGAAISSSNYESTVSLEPGQLASSSLYSLSPHFLGRADLDSFLRLTLSPETIPELGTGQLSLESVDENGDVTPVAPQAVTFSILEGPLESISQSGQITASVTYQDSVARVSAQTANFSGDLSFQVIETQDDNFQTYAGDKLPDDWQIQFFGIDALNAGPLDDYDQDGLKNFVEYFYELDPTSGEGFLFQFGGRFLTGDEISTGGISGPETHYVFDVLVPNELKSLSYEIQVSFDLTFTDLPAVTQIATAPWGPHFTRLTMATTTPEDAQQRAFVRLAISAPDSQ